MNKSSSRVAILVCLILAILWFVVPHDWLSFSRSPSETQGRAILQRQIQDQSQGNIDLISFKKINGVPDGNFYRLEYQAGIEFLNNGAWKRGNTGSEPMFFFFQRTSAQ